MPGTGASPAASFDGGDLDCGNGLLLLIRRHIDPLAPGQVLEILSREPSVAEDLPAWCRLTGNDLVGVVEDGHTRRFLVARRGSPRTPAAPSPGLATAPRPPGSAGSAEPGSAAPAEPGTAAPAEPDDARPAATVSAGPPATASRESSRAHRDGARTTDELPRPAPAPPLPPLAAVGIGSWPRPSWLLRSMHERLEGRLDEQAFQETADDAVRLVVAAQLRAGASALTDGEQRRDNYASFVASRLDNCQLIPITDLLPYVDDPEEFERELRALDVPAHEVRHPAVFGRLGRSRPLAVHELEFLRREAGERLPLKVALPGPYLLTRTMWMECVSDRAYATREELAADVVRVLREEAAALLAAGASIVQFDEPVLTEVVFGGTKRGGRTFMCGALGERGDAAEELGLARELLAAVTASLPEERLAMHVCRGNWTPDESVALAGDYRPLLELLSSTPVGTLFLEASTPRAGELEVLASLPDRLRIGVGVVNQKEQRVDDEAAVEARAERAVSLLGASRVLLTTDCGFATFADNPIAASPLAEAKLAVIARVAAKLRGKHALA